MMNRFGWYLVLSVVTLIIACATPTGVCGCTPAGSAVIVRGVLQDRDGKPLPNVRLGFEGIPRGHPDLDTLPVYASAVVRTNADGTFRLVAYSVSHPDTLQLRVALLPDSSTVAPPLLVVLARFRFESGPLDSLARTIITP